MQLIDDLLDLCKTEAHPIIAIDGPAGAGKTTLADHLKHLLSVSMSVAIIHMDDLYNGWNTPFDQHFTSALERIVNAHHEGAPISFARYDWAKKSYLPGEEMKATQLLILEGVASSSLAIRPSITVSIWLDIAPESGLQRVLERDGLANESQMLHWLEIQHQHFLDEDTQKTADFHITT